MVVAAVVGVRIETIEQRMNKVEREMIPGSWGLRWTGFCMVTSKDQAVRAVR